MNPICINLSTHFPGMNPIKQSQCLQMIKYNPNKSLTINRQKKTRGGCNRNIQELTDHPGDKESRKQFMRELTNWESLDSVKMISFIC